MTRKFKSNIKPILTTMRKFTILALIAFLMATVALAQRKAILLSPAFIDKEMMKSCDFVLLPGLDESYIKGEEAKLPKEGGFHPIGHAISANLTMENSGTWYNMPNGDKVWVLRVKTPGAIATTSEIFDFNIPAGTQFFIYDPAGQTRYGAYTFSDNGDFLGSDIVKGDEVVYEYVQPANVTGTPRLNIRDIFHLYRDVEFISSTKDFGDSESCEVNVRCSPVGDNWTDERRGVARIYVVSASGTEAGWCSGTLINNLNQDCKKYFLTAYHCGLSSSGTFSPTYTQWRFYFNYESSTCTNPTSSPSYNMLTGCSEKSKASITGGSDFILCELTGTITTAMNLYMNGWNAATTPTGPGVSIHHPYGDIKKISTYNTISTTTWSGGAASAHWRVVWVSNSNGWGVTEGGSSGSPLFDNSGKVIGTLTGGGSYCTAQSQPDAYGKMSYHWTSNGTASTQQLKYWLDPNTTGTTSLTGMNCPAGGLQLATVTTTAASAITNTSATSGGNVTNDGGATVTARGICYATTQNPTTANTVVNSGSGTGTFTSNLSGLTLGTTYYVRAFATNSVGTAYGNQISFTTTGGVIFSCDTLHYPLAGTATVYGSSNGGYVSGNNGYGDLAKADYFSGATSGWTISDVYIYFYTATGSSSQVPIKIWNNNGTGGAPSTVLGTVNIPISTIISNVGSSSTTLAHFAAPVAQDGTFFVGVVLPTVTGDTVAIVTNTDGDTNPGTGWEQFDTGVWYAYSSADSWEMNIQHAIWPVLCDPTNVSTSAANNKISMYPNPANDKLNLYFGNYNGEVDIVISDILGKELMRFTNNVSSLSNIKLDISGLQSGMYIINGVYGNNSFTDKLQIIK